jgi:hypothetical protein
MIRLAKAATTIQKEVCVNSICFVGKLTVVVDIDILIKRFIRILPSIYARILPAAHLFQLQGTI